MMRLGMTRRITPISEGVIRLCVIAPACVTWEGESARRPPPSRPPLFPFPLSVPVTLALMPPSDKTFFIQHWLTQK